MRVSKAYNTVQAMQSILARMAGGSAVTATACHVALFSGTPPTDDQLQAMIATANSQIAWTASTISAFATSANFLGDVALASFTPALDIDNNTLLIPLSAQANLATVASTGTPTWFMLRLTSATTATDTFVGFTTGTNAYVIITGTVGDENSAADMKVLGGTVTVGQPLRIADMRIKF